MEAGHSGVRTEGLKWAPVLESAERARLQQRAACWCLRCASGCLGPWAPGMGPEGRAGEVVGPFLWLIISLHEILFEEGYSHWDIFILVLETIAAQLSSSLGIPSIPS